ncbi:hypothetical protein GN956_G21545 [Arapaima gigas]
MTDFPPVMCCSQNLPRWGGGNLEPAGPLAEQSVPHNGGINLEPSDGLKVEEGTAEERRVRPAVRSPTEPQCHGSVFRRASMHMGLFGLAEDHLSPSVTPLHSQPC